MDFEEQKIRDFLGCGKYRRIYFIIEEEEMEQAKEWAKEKCTWAHITRNEGKLWLEGGLKKDKKRRSMEQELGRQVWAGIRGTGRTQWENIIEGEEQWYWKQEGTKEHRKKYLK